MIAYLDYLAFGYLHFKSYISIASINLIIIAGFIYGLFRQFKLPLYYFLPVPLLIFQPQYHEVTIWALTGLQHITLLLILCICLKLLKKPSPGKVTLAIVLAMLATFTHGNGILVFATGGFLLLIERNYKVLLPWVLFTLLTLVFYIFDYTPGSGVKSSINWAHMPVAFVAKIGATPSVWSPGSTGGSILWGTIISLVMIPTLLIAFYNSFKAGKTSSSANTELLSFFCFIFLTILLITIFRSSSQILLEIRFKIYAALSSVFFYLFLLTKSGRFRPITLAIATVLSVVFYISSYTVYTPEVVNKYTRLAADTYNWPKHQKELSNYNAIDASLPYLLPAYHQGFWRIPNLFAGFDEMVQTALQQKSFKPATLRTEHIMHGGDLPQLLVEMKEAPLRRQHLRDDLFLVLHDERQQKTYLAGTQPKFAGWRRFITTGSFFGPDFSTVLPLQVVPQGQYRLGCLLKDADNNLELIMTQENITL
ncbi:hypothetical protein [Larkinella knui]|uniref:Uncharacterized protein n=1 Tax=Larkinella knui TaxID=2025310 RepID=A0A3P1CXD0_9BACT|nr:hypothetical protein [Larkinella knui]RRB17740.1 hypothetical protein EHT87_05525 [Larkinella knui]